MWQRKYGLTSAYVGVSADWNLYITNINAVVTIYKIDGGVSFTSITIICSVLYGPEMYRM